MRQDGRSDTLSECDPMAAPVAGAVSAKAAPSGVGLAIRVKHGMLAGAVGHLVGHRGPLRAVADVRLREKTVRVHLPLDDLDLA